MLLTLSCLQSNRLTYPGMLDILPKDIINTLFIILPITAKRNFIRCNHELYSKTDIMFIYEHDFMIKIQKNYKAYLPKNITKLERYTLEMIYDNCERMIPTNYICSQNKLCNEYPFMYFYCAKSDNLSLLKKLLVYNSTNGKYITYGAARNGHLDVLKWARENGEEKDTVVDCIFSQPARQGCQWDSWTCCYAAQNGHLHVLKWAR